LDDGLLLGPLGGEVGLVGLREGEVAVLDALKHVLAVEVRLAVEPHLLAIVEAAVHAGGAPRALDPPLHQLVFDLLDAGAADALGA
jgi:hypothetical protein